MIKLHRLHNAGEPEVPLVLASFLAPWCTPCRRLPYILDNVQLQMKEQVAILPVNVQESPRLTEEFEVTSLPTLLILRDRHVLERLEGLHSSPEIIKYLSPMSRSRLDKRGSQRRRSCPRPIYIARPRNRGHLRTRPRHSAP